MRAKAIIDLVVESEESAPIKTHKGVEWRNSAGKWHRLDGPAREFNNGTKEWWVDGSLHREDGPAIDGPQGKFWFVRGLYHRTDGPAIEWADGSKEWHVNGLRHRVDGPADERSNGYKFWWINNRSFTEDEFYRYVDQATGEVFVPPGKKLEYDDDLDGVEDGGDEDEDGGWG